jgi:3-oxoacyl-[acyl-carrier-protein] synthase-1
MIVCGGAQEVNALSMGNFDAIAAFSTRHDDPTKASRPFDRDRDGLVPSGGAATVIIESYESAVKRGAPIIAEILGYGFSSNGEHISVPNVDGPVRSLKMALKQANLKPEDIDYLNAHATSTPVGDSNEAQAIYEVFKNTNIPVSSTKGMTGHEMWMGGASEVIYSILMAQNNFIAPNINFENPDEHSAKLNIISKTKEAKIDTFLSNSFGFGGTNSTLVVKMI